MVSLSDCLIDQKVFIQHLIEKEKIPDYEIDLDDDLLNTSTLKRLLHKYISKERQHSFNIFFHRYYNSIDGDDGHGGHEEDLERLCFVFAFQYFFM